jgi:hypothetical protein
MEDWHQACCRKRPLRASRAPASRPIPMAISRMRTKSAARGAAVSKNAALNRLSPRRLPTAFRSHWIRISRGTVRRIHSDQLKLTSQLPPYALEVESLPPIAAHAENSRQDSRPFNNPLGSFLFRKTTLCIFGGPPFSPGSVTQTQIPEGLWSRTLIANLFPPPAAASMTVRFRPCLAP